MAKYIELVGVPGIGKTTTYKYLKNIQSENDNWKLLEDIFRKPPPEKAGFKHKLKNILKNLLGLPTTYKVKVVHDNKVLDDFMTQNEDLINIFWEVTMTKNQNIDGKDLRFHSVYYMMMIFENLQAIKTLSSNKCYILDEGLILNLNYFTNEALEENLDSQISRVLDKIYLPVGLVLFEGDVETVIERTINRGKLKPRDQNMSEDMMRKSRNATACEKRNFVNAVQARNVPVLRINAKNAVESNAKEIARFAESLA